MGYSLMLIWSDHSSFSKCNYLKYTSLSVNYHFSITVSLKCSFHDEEVQLFVS